MKSRVPLSAQCRSSNTITTGLDAAIRSKNVRHAENSCSDPLAPPSEPSSASSAGSIQRRSASSGTNRATVPATLARVVASSSVSSSPQRERTISPSAHSGMPSPYAGDRPVCHQTSSTRPSMYLLNSHARRLLPMPAGPTTDTRRGRPSRDVLWNRSLSIWSSSSRPTKGASSALGPVAAADLRDDPLGEPGRHGCGPASKHLLTGRRRTRSRRRRHASSPRRRARSRGPPRTASRDAVLTRSPATIPCPRAPSVTAASPVSRPARAAMPSPSCGTAASRSSAARTARSASFSRAIGAPQTAITASPMNFSMVPP